MYIFTKWKVFYCIQTPPKKRTPWRKRHSQRHNKQEIETSVITTLVAPHVQTHGAVCAPRESVANAEPFKFSSIRELASSGSLQAVLSSTLFMCLTVSIQQAQPYTVQHVGWFYILEVLQFSKAHSTVHSENIIRCALLDTITISFSAAEEVAHILPQYTLENKYFPIELRAGSEWDIFNNCQSCCCSLRIRFKFYIHVRFPLTDV